jgi:hypothetical protein
MEDSMKRLFLLVVVPALLIALGSAQTPAASVDSDPTIEGCLGGTDGNYTVVEDGTGHIFKISAASVDFKQHLGHEVTLNGHKASGASSAAVNSFVVTELNMISEHCAAAAAAAPIAAIGTPSETATTAPADSAAPVATTSTLAQTEIIPVAPAATTVTAPAETTGTPDAASTPPAEATAPPPTDAAPTISTPWDKPITAAADPTRPPASSRRLSATTAAVATTPAMTASTPPETASTADAAGVVPAATASTPPVAASAPDAAPTPPTAPARHEALFLLILLGVAIIVTGTLVPFLGRWRKRKILEQTGAENLSFTREASPDQDKPDQPRKAA